MTPAISEINGRAFNEARERLGISLKELAKRSCFSVRQVEQIENGKSDAFYSLAIKVNAAKKIAQLLELSETEVFEFKVDPAATEAEITPLDANSNTEATDTGATTGSSKDLLNSNSLFGSQSSALKQELEPRLSSKLNRNSSLDSSSQGARLHRILLGGLLIVGIVFIATLIQSGVVEQIQALFYPKPIVAATIPTEEKPAEPENMRDSTVNENPSASVSATPMLATPSNTAPTVAPAAIAPIAANSLEGCPSIGMAASSYTPTQSSRSAEMVYIVSKANQTVCVVDANGKIQNRSLESGTSASFYGKPPFKVMTGGLSQVDLFYQGWKVRPTNPNEKIIELTPLISATPSNATPSSATPAGNSNN